MLAKRFLGVESSLTECFWKGLRQLLRPWSLGLFAVQHTMGPVSSETNLTVSILSNMNSWKEKEISGA